MIAKLACKLGIGACGQGMRTIEALGNLQFLETPECTRRTGLQSQKLQNYL